MQVSLSRAVLVAACAVALATAQITFSRDWTGGKRSPPLAADCPQLSRVCRHLVHELKQMMSVPARARRGDAADDTPAFDEEN